MFDLFKKKLKAVVDAVSKKVSKEEVEGAPAEKVKEEKERIERVPELKKTEKAEKVGALGKIKKAIVKKELGEDFLEDALSDLEFVLLENNVAAETAAKIVSDVKEKLKGESVKRAEAEKIISETLRADVKDILGQPAVDILEIIKKAKAAGRPAVILFFGFNGTGKSLTVAKIAALLKKAGHKPILAAGDTFRAAGIEQLEEYAKGVDVPVVKHKQGADSAAVIFDAIKAAASRGNDVVLADTAGRAHTDKNLVDELKKIVRVAKPDLKLLVCEALAGSDVANQARVFNEAAKEGGGIDGFILTKWDVDEKGGAALSLCSALKKPILFLGTGQNYDDLEKFDLEKVMKNIFG